MTPIRVLYSDKTKNKFDKIHYYPHFISIKTHTTFVNTIFFCYLFICLKAIKILIIKIKIKYNFL